MHDMKDEEFIPDTCRMCKTAETHTLKRKIPLNVSKTSKIDSWAGWKPRNHEKYGEQFLNSA